MCQMFIFLEQVPVQPPRTSAGNVRSSTHRQLAESFFAASASAPRPRPALPSGKRSKAMESSLLPSFIHRVGISPFRTARCTPFSFSSSPPGPEDQRSLCAPASVSSPASLALGRAARRQTPLPGLCLLSSQHSEEKEQKRTLALGAGHGQMSLHICSGNSPEVSMRFEWPGSGRCAQLRPPVPWPRLAGSHKDESQAPCRTIMQQ